MPSTQDQFPDHGEVKFYRWQCFGSKDSGTTLDRRPAQSFDWVDPGEGGGDSRCEFSWKGNLSELDQFSPVPERSQHLFNNFLFSQKNHSDAKNVFFFVFMKHDL